MNLTKLKNNQIQLIEHMQKGGYSKSYINNIKTEINHLLNNENKYQNYVDYYENFIKTNKKNIIHRKSIITIIMNFDLYNEFPNRNHCKYKLVDTSNYFKLNSYYKGLIDFYKVESVKKGKKDTTIHNETLNCSCFLIYLQNKGYSDFENVKPNDVIDFFLDDNKQLKFSHSYEKNIKIVLKSFVMYDENCIKIVEMMPTIKSSRKNIDYLTNEEIQKIKYVLTNDDNTISLRDKAIVSLLLYTGLRKIDIVNLKLSNINWSNEIINIIQSKTDVSLEIPLTTSVGNALFKYISTERPKIDLDNIFIREDANYSIGSSSVEIAVCRIFKEANIRQNDNKRKGTHIFRYNLATSLLKNEIPQPIISQVLGHNSSNSLRFYLSADFYHLKQCSLSIEQFENIKEIL